MLPILIATQNLSGLHVLVRASLEGMGCLGQQRWSTLIQPTVSESMHSALQRYHPPKEQLTQALSAGAALLEELRAIPYVHGTAREHLCRRLSLANGSLALSAHLKLELIRIPCTAHNISSAQHTTHHLSTQQFIPCTAHNASPAQHTTHHLHSTQHITCTAINSTYPIQYHESYPILSYPILSYL